MVRILVLVILFLGCENKKQPEGVLSHDSMVHTLMELHLAERKLLNLGLRHDSIETIFEKAKPAIFEKAGVKEDQFNESLNYYRENPIQLEAIYTALIDSLNLREQRAQISDPNEKKRNALPE